jgi:hypothetical protein
MISEIMKRLNEEMGTAHWRPYSSIVDCHWQVIGAVTTWCSVEPELPPTAVPPPGR